LNFYYATQVRQAPPTFLLFVNRDELFSDQYKKYLSGEMRKAFGYEGCPIVLAPKPRPKTIDPVRKPKQGHHKPAGKRERFQGSPHEKPFKSRRHDSSSTGRARGSNRAKGRR
jgi:hypothetical protein